MFESGFFCDLRVAFCEGDGTDLRVDIYGGDDPLCGSVVLTFDSAEQRAEQEMTACMWRDTDTVVHLSHRRGEAVLTRATSSLDLR